MLKGKTAVISGGTRGIGLSCSEFLASVGANIAICARTLPLHSQAREAAEKYGVKYFEKAVDISNSEECTKFIEEVHSQMGAVDVLVNNAGITRDTLAMRMSDDDFNAVINTNLAGAFYLSRAAIKIMTKQRAGRIINMTSVVGQMGGVGQANYSAAKAGLIGLTKSLAKEYASRNILVNAVAPGFVNTSMTDALSDDYKAKISEVIPLKRAAEPYEIAKVVVFLASDAASYITGQVIGVNGGMYM